MSVQESPLTAKIFDEWTLRPENADKIVEVHQPGQKTEFVEVDGVVRAESILSGFELALKDIFK